MNIVLLGHEDIASLYALDCLIQLCPDHSFTAFWSGPMAARKTPAPALEALDAVDRSLYDAYRGRPDIAAALVDASILAAPNSPEGLDVLNHAQPDLIVSVRYRRILKEAAIAIPARGVINLHSGILPDYRGVMATFWAMLAGESEIGTTLHFIVDAGIDTGPVVSIHRQPVDSSRSYLHNLLSMYAPGAAQIAQAIDEIDRTGTVPAAIQPRGAGAYFGPPGEADAQNFLETGQTLADGQEFRNFRTLVRNS